MRVLLPIGIDESKAIAAAEAVTSIPNAAEAVDVIILNVQEEVEVTGADGGHASSSEWYDETDFPKSVEKAASLLEGIGITVKKRRKHSDPTEAIIKMADEIEADRIIMSGRKQTPVGKVLFGSVTQSVLLSANTPVTVVGMSN